MMDRDFFIKLVFGTHKVADLLTREGKEGDQLKVASSNLLSDLLLICEENPVTLEQKKNVLPRTLRGIGQVQSVLNRIKDGSKVNPTNFAILEQEYKKIPDILVEFFAAQNLLNPIKEEMETKPGLGFGEVRDEKGDVPKSGLGEIESPKPDLRNLSASPSTALRTNLSVRQEKILEFLKTKEKAQVWELQKMLPEPVTKRTLRRDMDYLMQQGRVERQGEWNGVFYKLSPTKELLT